MLTCDVSCAADGDKLRVDRMAFRVDRELCSLGHFPQRLRFLSFRFVALAECFCLLRFGEVGQIKSDAVNQEHK
ncbi:Malonyl-[acyl-carrier protein] O-methyltransferase [Trichinella spiralis]|uniref:Uncharacterized protein n=2 Tax=Trichinella spiralis TaxID=6334 RepID=A0A0V1B8W4_TRISP|nr:hypothetical protein T01_12295 [Trichinella spiralis]